MQLGLAVVAGNLFLKFLFDLWWITIYLNITNGKSSIDIDLYNQNATPPINNVLSLINIFTILKNTEDISNPIYNRILKDLFSGKKISNENCPYLSAKMSLTTEMCNLSSTRSLFIADATPLSPNTELPVCSWVFWIMLIHVYLLASKESQRPKIIWNNFYSLFLTHRRLHKIKLLVRQSS